MGYLLLSKNFYGNKKNLEKVKVKINNYINGYFLLDNENSLVLNRDGLVDIYINSYLEDIMNYQEKVEFFFLKENFSVKNKRGLIIKVNLKVNRNIESSRIVIDDQLFLKKNYYLNYINDINQGIYVREESDIFFVIFNKDYIIIQYYLFEMFSVLNVID